MKNGNRKFSFLSILLIALLASNSLYSKPMIAPTPEEAVHSKWIVIVEFIGYKKTSSGKITYFNGPLTQYKIVESLKGNFTEKNVEILYDFGDGSACIAPRDWKFNKDKMPLEKSKWILFLKGAKYKGSYRTYRGDYGRWKATEENIKKIKKFMTESKK